MHEGKNRIRVHAFVFGRVQGVAFRWHCHRAACGRGLGGWVRNTPDGGVELEAEGPGDQVDSFMEDVRRGPAGSRVDSVVVDPRPLEDSDEFNIRF